MKIITAKRNLELVEMSHQPVACFFAGAERSIRAIFQVALNALALLLAGLFVSKETRKELFDDMRKGCGHLGRGIMEAFPLPSYIFFEAIEKHRNLDPAQVTMLRPGEEDAAFT